jgi:hypothetical protein
MGQDRKGREGPSGMIGYQTPMILPAQSKRRVETPGGALQLVPSSGEGQHTLNVIVCSACYGGAAARRANQHVGLPGAHPQPPGRACGVFWI